MKRRDSWKALRDQADALERLATLLGFEFAYELTPEFKERDKEKIMSGTIEIKEGESMADALLRTAKEKTAVLLIGNSQSQPAPTPKKKASKKADALPAEGLGGDPNEGQPVEATIFMALHIYQREGETPEKVRMNAKHEREMHGPGTLVFAHMHTFGSMCSSACKVRIVS